MEKEPKMLKYDHFDSLAEKDEERTSLDLFTSRKACKEQAKHQAEKTNNIDVIRKTASLNISTSPKAC